MASMALLGVMVFGTSGQASAGSIIYVKQNASGLNNGSSWTNAYKSLQTALAHAVSGQQIWVAKGTYWPTAGTDQTISFRLKNGVAIYGGFAGNETALSKRNPPVNVTVLNGDIGVLGDASDNSYHVVLGNGTNRTAILDGFTILRGNASLTFTSNGDGGGMYNFNSSPTLRNLTFSFNSASGNGGGMYNEGSSPKLTTVSFVSGNAISGGGMYNFESAPVLSHVTFASNSATDGAGMSNVAGGNPILNGVIFASNSASNNGGGMYDSGGTPTVSNSQFNGNTASSGAGLYNNGSSPSLNQVSFDSNAASGNGGGMFNVGSSPTLTNAVFTDNSASYGGAIHNLNGSSPTIAGAMLSGNSAANNGGGIYNDGGSSPALTNLTLSGNTALAGGGMFNEINSSPTLTNVTFSGNSATSTGGMANDSNSNPTVNDSIFWGDGTPEISDISSKSTIYDSIVQTGCPGTAFCSNVSLADPMLGPLQDNGGFTETMALLSGSAAIDAGSKTSCAATDQRGVARPQGGACDMGAYEVRARTFRSQAANDGQVLESSTVDNIGGSVNSTNAVLRVGDNSADRQWYGFLSFNTAALPDIATIVLTRVTVKQAAAPAGNPFVTLGPLVADLTNPRFGSSAALVSSDWQASATQSEAGMWLPDGSLYWTSLNNAAMSDINKTGTTQIRLRFASIDTNQLADYITVFSGDTTVAANRPSLTVYYNP